MISDGLLQAAEELKKEGISVEVSLSFHHQESNAALYYWLSVKLEYLEVLLLYQVLSYRLEVS
jgi:hypothetical protein